MGWMTAAGSVGAAVVATVAGSVVTGCSNRSTTTTLDVYAASSLTTVFTEIEADFERANPSIDVRLNLAGSNDLARQVNAGAPASVFAPADVSVLDQLDTEPAGDPVVFATNTLTLIVPADNPAGIGEPADLSRPGVLVARCVAGVPCGDATDRFLTNAAISPTRTTDEQNVRSVLAKVVAGEVDAGFVYHSDTMAVEEEVAEIPLPGLAPTVRVVAVSLDGSDPAERFVAYLSEPSVARRLADLGFAPA